MSQGPQSDHQGTQPDSHGAFSNDPHASTQDTPPITHSRRVSIQEPPPITQSHRVSIQEPPPITQSCGVSIQEPPTITHSRRVSIQEPLTITQSRRVSIQEPLTITQSRRVSIQEPPPITQSRRVSIQEPPTITQSRRVSIQEPPTITHSRRVSIQEPPTITQSRRVSIQEPPPITHSLRVSSQEPLTITHSRRVSIQEPPPITQNHWVSNQESQSGTPSHRVSIQEPLTITPSRRVNNQEPPLVTQSRRVSIQEPLPITQSHLTSNQDALSTVQTHHISILPPPSITHSLQGNIKTSTLGSYNSLTGIPGFPPATQSFRLSTLEPPSLTQANVDVFPSIMDNLKAGVKHVDSIIWSSWESFKDSGHNSQHISSKPVGKTQKSRSGIFSGTSSVWSQRHSSHRYSLMPVGFRLLLQAKKISRLLGLVLCVAGMVVIGVITLGQPWIHFQVPLRPAGDPAGPHTIAITTIFFAQCPDISCLHEYDQNAYLLDFAWAFFIISSLTSLCLCIALINTIFFNSSSSPMMDFSFFVASILTATSMILGVLFYLLQAQEYLQEGMTYRLGCSFYLAWTGIFFFLISGLFSYLNYMNFWSILALQAIWN